MSHFGPPDSIRRRVARPDPGFSEPAQVRGACWATRQHSTTRGEAGCAQDPRTRRNPENSRSSWGPPHDEPFWATRQHSTTRGEASFLGCLVPGFSGRVPFLTGGRPFLARNASARLQKCPQDHRPRRNPENRNFRPRPGDPLTRQHSTTRGEEEGPDPRIFRAGPAQRGRRATNSSWQSI